jgi:hypothetical protein
MSNRLAVQSQVFYARRKKEKKMYTNIYYNEKKILKFVQESILSGNIK